MATLPAVAGWRPCRLWRDGDPAGCGGDIPEGIPFSFTTLFVPHPLFPAVIVGIDAGGTNVDAALVDEEVQATAKVPAARDDALEAVLDDLLADVEASAVDRIVVATTRVLNAAVQDRLPDCTAVLVPGPGLAPERSFYAEQNHVAAGCVDHRGRITEELAYDREPGGEVVAAVAKFSPRNPALEEELRDQLDDEKQVALGSASGPGLTFPERAATTVANAKARPTMESYADELEAARKAAGTEAPVYYLEGDAAMVGDAAARSTPAGTLRGGPAASTLGLRALADLDSAVCLDVGGTTTDVTVVHGGRPGTVRGAEVGDLVTSYEGVASLDLPIGGDTLVTEAGLARRREGPAAAFGGQHPTLTDALVVSEAFDGDDPAAPDRTAARRAFERFDRPRVYARTVVDAYVEAATGAVEAALEDLADSNEPAPLVAGGVLAPELAPRIAEAADGVGRVVVPEGAEVAGAVGCAVARVSVRTAVHVDSARATLTTTEAGGTREESVSRGRRFDDEEVRKLAIEKARAAARRAGADWEKGQSPACEVLDARRFNVVERRHVQGEVVDAVAQVEPGVRRTLGADSVVDSVVDSEVEP